MSGQKTQHKSGYKLNPCRDCIVDLLEGSDGMTVGEISEKVLAAGFSTASGVQAAINRMFREGMLTRDTTVKNKHRYRLNDDARQVLTVDADHFTVPAELLGEPLSPMAWSMRHLLGA